MFGRAETKGVDFGASPGTCPYNCEIPMILLAVAPWPPPYFVFPNIKSTQETEEIEREYVS